MAKRLVINADDLGMTAACDRAIQVAWDAIAITSASWLASDEPQPQSLPCGVHLRLTDGKPMLPPEQVPSLVDADGNFPRSQDIVSGRKVNPEEVRTEWSQQICWAHAHCTHFDSHHNVHDQPETRDVYADLCAEYGVVGVPMSGRQRDQLRSCGVRCADWMESRWLDGSSETLKALLTEDFRRHETVWLMAHPGIVDDELKARSFMTDVRERELITLLALGPWLESQGIELIAPHEIPDAPDPLAKVDIIFLQWHRAEFSAESLKALAINTDWTRVNRLVVYTDGAVMQNGMVAREPIPVDVLEYNHEHWGGPVAIMNHYLSNDPAPWFVKLDNDVIVPPGWLQQCLQVLKENPSVDLLGIEPVWPVSRTNVAIGVSPIGHIGGIGFMRSSVFSELPVPAGRMGFSDWQVHHPEVNKAWLNPGLPVILLDRLPFEPWASLSAEYEAKGWQRPWKRYTDADKAIWEWWTK